MTFNDNNDFCSFLHNLAGSARAEGIPMEVDSNDFERRGEGAVNVWFTDLGGDGDSLAVEVSEDGRSFCAYHWINGSVAGARWRPISALTASALRAAMEALVG